MSILSRLASLLREEAAYWRDPDRAEKNRDADKFRGMSEDEYDTYLETEYRLDQERASIRERERSERIENYLGGRSAAYEDKRNETTIGNTSDVRT